MLRNYLKTIIRHLKKNKVNFTFKLGGLSLAIFSFLVISIYTSHQLSFDTFHDDYENIYRINAARKQNGQLEKYATAPMAIGAILEQSFPEIASSARIRYANTGYIRYDNKVFDAEALMEADSSLFDVLTFRFVKGTKDALKNPNGIVLTRRMARNIFGDTEPLQKVVSLNNSQNLYQVTAVVEELPTNSHLLVDAIVPIREKHDFTLNSIISPVEFVDYASPLYIRFKAPVNAGFDAKVESLLDRYIKRQDRIDAGFSLSFQPLKDIYLGSDLKYDFASRKGSVTYLYAFSVLAVLLLMVAGINYVNLSIADFSGRSRETGVRKVLGARKHQLMGQVVLETLFYILVSLVIGVGLLYLFFPSIVQYLDSDLNFEMLLHARVMMFIGVGLFGVIVFSTWLPARYANSTGIIQSLKSKTGSYNSTISQMLLFAQFTISAICICCTLMVRRQIGFIHNKELGFNKKDLLVLGMPEGFTVKNMQMFKQELKSIAGVTNVSNSSFRIGSGYWKDWYTVEDKNGMKSVELYEVFSDDELFSTLGIKVLQGRAFNANMPSDSGAAFVINETAARELGYDDPVGKRIYTHPEEKGKWDGTIVGVVSDINIDALYEKVHPLVMRLPWQSDTPEYFVYVRYQGSGPDIVKAIEKKYNAVSPGYPLMCRFVDELYDASHRGENKIFASLQFGTFVIVLVSMLGIFSLAAYLSIRRMKEFGIRKVLGASVTQIAGLHIGYFMRIVLIANVVALPIGYWLMKEWLDGFAYKTEVTALPFLVVAGISFLLVIFSAGYSSWNAGRMNPVDVIKAE